MATLTLKKKLLTNSKKRKLAHKWLKDTFPFYKNKLHPWQNGISQVVKNKYRETEHEFPIKSISFCLYIRRNKCGYDESKPRVDINGETE